MSTRRVKLSDYSAKQVVIMNLLMIVMLTGIVIYQSTLFLKRIEFYSDFVQVAATKPLDFDHNEVNGNAADNVVEVMNFEDDRGEIGSANTNVKDYMNNGAIIKNETATSKDDGGYDKKGHDNTEITQKNTGMNLSIFNEAGSTDRNSCTFQNSKAWLTSKRLSNIDEKLMTDELIESLILDISPLDTDNGSRDVLEQSLCLGNSSFVNWKPTKTKFKNSASNVAFSEDRAIKDIAFRLMFLAFHEHQYGPARNEAISRYRNNSSCSDSLKQNNVSRLDFECPGTKYFVVNVPRIGFGSAVRMGLMDPMFLGLVSGRVVLFMNSLPSGRTEGLKNRWKLASCPRRDMQCSFMPSSPCVITEEDLERAPILAKDDLNEIRKNGKLGPEYDDEKVLIWQTDADGHKPVPLGLRTAFVNIISSLYDERKARKESDHDWELDEQVLQKAKDFILDEKSDAWITHQAATFYVFRPNMETRHKIEEAMNLILPEDFNSQSSFGFPIRASDKCLKESICLSFDENMQLAEDFTEMRKNQLKKEENKNVTFDTIMLTSEDKAVIDARLRYNQNNSFPFKFIISENDAGQGTGHPWAYSRSAGDHIMLSSLISLKMQLHTESLVVNECSNFHKVIYDLVLHGCGANNYIETLKENDNPKYQLACSFD